MNKKRGFTLVELAVALAIAAIIMGLVVVQVDGWSSLQSLRTAVRALGNTIRLYREKAQAEEETFTLKIDCDRGTYVVTARGETLRSGRLGAGQRFGKIHAGERELESPVLLQLGPRGILPEMRITMTNATKESMTLVICPLANEVSYAEPEPK